MEIEFWHLGLGLLGIWVVWVSTVAIQNKNDIAVMAKDDEHKQIQLSSIMDSVTSMSEEIKELRQEVKDDIKEINAKMDSNFKELLLMFNK